MALIDRLNAIGDAIREKNGTNALIPLKDMPDAILDIVSGGGVTYTNIVYNQDNTITLTDTYGAEHTMECEYTDGKLSYVRYDGKTAALKYVGDVLVSVGGTAIDMANVPTEMDAVESLIDNSEVLEDAEGSVNEKVEQLIDLAYISSINKTLDFDGLSITGDFVFDCKNIMNISHAFRRTTLNSIHLSNTNKVTNWNDAFYWCIAETIETLDFSSCVYLNKYTFNSGELKNLKLVPQTLKVSLSLASCPNLSAESIQSIIDGLATVETAQTLTLNSAIVLTDEQKATINEKGWTLAQ